MADEAPFEPTLSELAYHGGNLSAARRLFPDAPQPWIDLSTGLNPEPYPLPPLSPEAWARLPEPHDLAALESVAARRYGANAKQTIAAPGAQALIQLLARLRPARRVGVLGRSYSGHSHAWRAAGAYVETVEALEALGAFDIAVVVNPNNPDGRLTARASLLRLHEAIAAAEGLLVVDEAFMDLQPGGQSLVPVLPARRVIVLRSFGKAYGLAGLRLGFAVASADLVADLRACLGPWPVSGPAIEIGRRALADDGWLEGARLRRARDCARLDRLLGAGGFELIGGTALFRLACRQDARETFLRLLRRGILTRPFDEAPDRLRFGIPAGAEAWRRLEAALSR